MGSPTLGKSSRSISHLHVRPSRSDWLSWKVPSSKGPLQLMEIGPLWCVFQWKMVIFHSYNTKLPDGNSCWTFPRCRMDVGWMGMVSLCWFQLLIEIGICRMLGDGWFQLLIESSQRARMFPWIAGGHVWSSARVVSTCPAWMLWVCQNFSATSLAMTVEEPVTLVGSFFDTMENHHFTGKIHYLYGHVQ